jgi:hypothetical protein
MVAFWTAVVLAVGCAGAVMVALFGLRFSREVARSAADSEFVALACASALVAGGSAVMHAADVLRPSTLTLVAAGGLMVLAPALFATALLRRSGASALWFALPAGLVLVAVLAPWGMTPEWATWTKVAAGAVGGAAIVFAVARARVRTGTIAGMRVVLVTALGYTGYLVARTIYGFPRPGAESAEPLFASPVSIVVSAIVVVALGWGTVRMTWIPARRIARVADDRVIRVTIEDVDLIRVGLGTDTVCRLSSALTDACETVGEVIEVQHGAVRVHVADGRLDEARAAIRGAYSRATGVDGDGEVGTIVFAA